MSALGSKSALQAGVEQVTQQAAGALEIVVVMQHEIPEAILTAMAGNPAVVQVAQMIMQTLAGIEGAPRHSPMLCAVCPQPLRINGRFSLAMALPACDSPAQALGLAICGKCATEPTAVQAKAIEALRKIWPTLRMGRITHPQSGRA